MRQILWGLFKKIVIADNCAEFANHIFNNSADISGSTLVLGGLFFTFQIYCDFSGYSDIAIGTARLFGFNLKRNFAFPYFSRDIGEFWRRWHISLSTWFRDYLYIPLGGSRGGVRCESLEQLSYKNETFDLVISSDILEHVRKPMLAFAEIYRVLRPGGVHIFSIPVEYPMPAQTIARVDVTGEVDVHLLPEHYHGDGAGGKSLVYNDFGADVIRQLNHMGYMCETERPRPGCPEAGKMLTFLSWKM